MRLLVDNVPEARDFCTSVIANFANFKLFPDEEFQGFADAVFTTTGVDMQGERLDPSGLKDYALGLTGPAMWIGAHHDPLIQPIGRVLAARPFYSKTDDLHFVAGVIGYFDVQRFPKLTDVLQELSPSRHFQIEPGAELVAEIELSRHEIDPAELEEVVQSAPDFVARRWIPRFRKSADPMAILSIAVSVGVALGNPFSKKFLEVFGEAAAKQLIEFIRWIAGPLAEKIHQLKVTPMLEFYTRADGCLIQLVIDRQNVGALPLAASGLLTAFQTAMAMADQMVDLHPDKLVWEFDAHSGAWLPLYAVTRKLGVITDRPKLVALDTLRGLSGGGRGKYLPDESGA